MTGVRSWWRLRDSQRHCMEPLGGEAKAVHELYTTPRLSITDEIGYSPIEHVGANLFSS